MKIYNSAPLPFQGQKRYFLPKFREVIATLPDDAVIVDLFGGSGLLSHTAHVVKPRATVIYNDFDNFRARLEAVPETNALLARIRPLVADIPHQQRLPEDVRQKVLDVLRKADAEDYVDYVSISASLLFSGKYADSLHEFENVALYQRMRSGDFAPAPGYLDGLTIAHADYREVFARYKDEPRAVFLLDPPYLCTDVKSYATAWRLADYLDVLTLIHDQRFIYFTSERSHIIDLYEWLDRIGALLNPLQGAQRHECQNTLNHSADYKDIMLVKVS